MKLSSNNVLYVTLMPCFLTAVWSFANPPSGCGCLKCSNSPDGGSGAGGDGGDGGGEGWVEGDRGGVGWGGGLQ